MTLNHLEGALAWWDAGCSVIPIKADGTKKPFGKWKDYQTFRAQRRKVEQWFKTTPNWGVGLICGEVSGGLEMLELESKAMDSVSLDKVTAAMKRHGMADLWRVLTVEQGYAEYTPSGGLHLLYRITDHPVPGNTKIANRPPTAGELESKPDLRSVTLAETRGEGGFVIVAPSRGAVHPTGESWSVGVGSVGVIPNIMWEERNLLVAALHEALDTMPPPPPRVEPARSTVAQDFGDGLAPGADFNAKANWPDLLNSYGWTYHSQYFGSAEELWTRPGKEAHDGHSASVGYQGSDNLYCWSSAAGLPIEEPISKFGFYTFMEHFGDFSAAGKALKAQGYGTSTPLSQVIDITDWFNEESVDMPAAVDTPVAVDPPTGVVPEPVRLNEWTETGVAHMMLPIFGDRFRMVHEEKAFRAYRDGAWTPDTTNRVIGAVEKATEHVRLSAAQKLADAKLSEDKDDITDAKKLVTTANGFRSARGINAITTRFGQQRKVSAEMKDFDRDNMLLCLDNGTFDMRTMELREHRPADMLTKRIGVSYDPDATCAGFLKFLQECIPDAADRQYLKTALGMTALGSVREAAFMVLQGLTGCGKSQFVKIAHALLGEYATTAAPGTFRESKGRTGSETYELHDLRGVRMASMSETSEGDVLNEELLKRITGGDMVKSRALFQNFVEWKPQFTVWVATNFLPRLNAGDDAIWRRVKVIKFPNQFKGDAAEIGIAERLIDTELPGILNWLLEGVTDYLANGLKDPETMKAQLEEYRNDVDPVVQFLTETIDNGTIVKDADAMIGSTDLHRVFRAWSEANGTRNVMNQTRFGRRMSALGYDTQRSTGGVKMRKGLKLNPGVWQAEAQGRGVQPNAWAR